ncbi:hypothetical protein N0V88_006547 [Collariella sp. IMI 366227]|nr:hypothetical protein N0V88_006547 [Collariella sp. IMI 366227]
MALNFASAVGANSDFLKVVQPIAARGQISRIVRARNDSSVPTVNMFIDGNKNAEFVASIVDACGGQTTFALRCTAGGSGCSPNGPAITVTANPTTYIVSTATVSKVGGQTVSATVQELCDLKGTTAAVCTAIVGGTVAGQSTTTSSTGTVEGTDYHRFDVSITAGAEKTANPSAECKAKPNGANTKAVAMWGLVGVAGIVATLVGF